MMMVGRRRSTLSTTTALFLLMFSASAFHASFRIRNRFLMARSSSLSLSTSPKAVSFTAAAPSTMSSKPARNTGGLRRLPVVRSPVELLDKAKKTVWRVKPDPKVKNIRNRARKHGAETLNALSQAMCLPLRDIVNGYKTEWKRLHPFERVVADLTVRSRQSQDGLELNQVLDEIHEARKILLEAGKDWISKIKQAESAKEADVALAEGTDAMVRLFESFANPPVARIMQLQRSLRSAPIVQLDTPAVVLVGAPNVGKSSIVRCISSGTPEVNNYPFTTRGMTLGHVQVFWADAGQVAGAVVPAADDPLSSRKSSGDVDVMDDKSGVVSKYAFSQLCQIMDSPGLLVRPDEERNEMEALTLAAMQHLPCAVCFVMDLSGEAGDRCSSITDQLHLRREVRKRFPRRPWIDVVSKVDLGVEDGALEELQGILGNDVPYIKLSIHQDVGVQELRTQILRMLGEVRVVLDVMAAVNVP